MEQGGVGGLVERGGQGVGRDTSSGDEGESRRTVEGGRRSEPGKCPRNVTRGRGETTWERHGGRGAVTGGDGWSRGTRGVRLLGGRPLCATMRDARENGSCGHKKITTHVRQLHDTNKHTLRLGRALHHDRNALAEPRRGERVGAAWRKTNSCLFSRVGWWVQPQQTRRQPIGGREIVPTLG